MRKLGLALLAAAVTAAPVSAGSPGWDWSWLDQCGGDNFITCMSGSISYNGSGVITVMVTNAAPYNGDVFTAVGLFNVPAGHAPISYTSSMAGWTAPTNGINGNLPGPNSQTWTSGVSGINGGFDEADGEQTFTFTFAQSSWAAILGAENTIGVGIHAQGGPRDCSTKMGVQNLAGSPDAGIAVVNFAPEEDCSVSVPEPESMALLATGLFGLAFVGARRRRNPIA